MLLYIVTTLLYNLDGGSSLDERGSINKKTNKKIMYCTVEIFLEYNNFKYKNSHEMEMRWVILAKCGGFCMFNYVWFWKFQVREWPL